MDFNSCTNNDEIEVFYCAIAKESHILYEPVRLSCNHFMCKRCVSSSSSQIKCSKCEKTNENDLTNAQIEEFDKTSVDCYLSKLLDRLFESFKTGLYKLKEVSYEANQKIEYTTEFLKECVEIRIETLKIELDLLREKYINDLEIMRNESKEKLMENDITTHGEKYEWILENMQNLKSNGPCIDQLYEYQSCLNDLNSHIMKLEEFSKQQFEFEPADTKINESMIGTVSLRNSIITDKIKAALATGKFEIKDVKFLPRHCIALPNSNVVFSCDNLNDDTPVNLDGKIEEYLAICDSELNVIKIIEKINNNKIDPAGIAIDKNSIYIADYRHNKIFKTDFDFNFIKSETFSRPLALLFSHESLYVCQERSLKRLSPNLDLLNEYDLHFIPRNIKIIGNTALMRPFRENAMYFYEICGDKFNLKQKVNGHNGVIGMIESMFYEYDNITKTMYKYNPVGELIEQIETPNYGTGVASIMCVNNKLLIPIQFKKVVSINL